MDDVEDEIPVLNREKRIAELNEWLQEQPTTLALVRFPPEDETEHTGVFHNLGTTELYAFEVNGGVRAGHEYWHVGENVRIHVRWMTLRTLFSEIQQPDDDTGVRRALRSGSVLFDEVNIVEAAEIAQERGVEYRRLRASTVQKYRVKTHEIIDKTYELETSVRSPDDEALEQLMELVHELSNLLDDFEGGKQSLNTRASSITNAGQSKQHYTEALRDLRSLAGELQEQLGGKPAREWYIPSDQSHLIPPLRNMDDEKREIDDDEYESCSVCFRRFRRNPQEPAEDGDDLIEDGPPRTDTP